MCSIFLLLVLSSKKQQINNFHTQRILAFETSQTYILSFEIIYHISLLIINFGRLPFILFWLSILSTFLAF